MPQLLSLKFSQEEMPHLYDPGEVEELRVQDFVVAEREDGEDVGFIAGVEWVSREQLKLRPKAYKRVLRRATDDEKEQYFLRRLLEKKAVAVAKEKAAELRLPMKITTVRYDARDGRLVFLFVSEERVDFRALVRELSLILKTRIELWQIGVRQEAKVVDGFGVCGLKTCCSTWLPEFRPITIKMAKDQDINLPPTKLAGQCGRLLCCLSYEVDQYKEMARQLMPKGATLEVNGQRGVIIDRNIIRQSYTVQFGDGSTSSVPADQAGDAQVPEQMKRMAGVVARGGADVPATGGKRGDRTPPEKKAFDQQKPPRGDERPGRPSKGAPPAAQQPPAGGPAGSVRQRFVLPGQRPGSGPASGPPSGPPRGDKAIDKQRGRTGPGGRFDKQRGEQPAASSEPLADSPNRGTPAGDAPSQQPSEGRSGRRRGRDRNRPGRPDGVGDENTASSTAPNAGGPPPMAPPPRGPKLDANDDEGDDDGGPDDATDSGNDAGAGDPRTNEGRRKRRRRGGRGRRGGGGGGAAGAGGGQPPSAPSGDA